MPGREEDELAARVAVVRFLMGMKGAVRRADVWSDFVRTTDSLKD
jgi:hypothetical protein